MNPVRKRRLLVIVLILAAAALAITLLSMALQRNVAYLYTPSEVLRGEAGDKARFRLGGMVAEHSFKRATGSLEARFEVDDGDARMPVVYTGILPDLFREKQGVIARGTLGADGVFRADEILAKHDENYMPPEVQADMARSGYQHQSQK